jgi:hypothetical protein
MSDAPSSNGSSSGGPPFTGPPPAGSGDGAPRSARRRPIGVSLLTVFDGVAIGVFPAVLALLPFFAGPGAAAPPVLPTFATLLLSAGAVWTAAETWRGTNGGRIGLLVVATIHYVGLLFGADYAFDLAAPLAPDEATAAWVRAARSLFWIGLHGWYLFFSRAARRYFE